MAVWSGFISSQAYLPEPPQLGSREQPQLSKVWTATTPCTVDGALPGTGAPRPRLHFCLHPVSWFLLSLVFFPKFFHKLSPFSWCPKGKQISFLLLFIACVIGYLFASRKVICVHRGKSLRYMKSKEENKGHDPVIKTEPLLMCLAYSLLRAFSMSIDNLGIISADRVSYPDFSIHHGIRSGKKIRGEERAVFMIIQTVHEFQLHDPEPQIF